MAAPRTPSKTDGINDCINALNRSWGLGLPIQDAQTSPSKAALNTTIEGRIVKQIQRLYWTNRKELHDTVQNFNARATTPLSDWVYKPRADTDHLPNRNVLAVGQLNDMLYRMLTEDRADRSLLPRMHTGSPRRREHTVQDQSTHKVHGRRDSEDSYRDVFEDSQFDKSLIAAMQQSTQFPINNIQDSSETVTTNKGYVTPPERRSSTPEFFTSSMEALQITRVEAATNRKRLSVETNESLASPRKSSRVHLVRVDHPVLKHSERARPGRSSSQDSLSTVSSQAATPNISPTASFDPTTANTSFGSPTRASHVKNLTLQAPADHECGLHPRLCEGVGARNADADYRDDASTKPGLDTKTCTYEALFSKSPFIHTGLSEFEFSLRMSYEVIRVAIETDVSPQLLFDKFKQHKKFDVPDYGEVCTTLKSALQKQQKILPNRSDAAVWDRAVGRFQNVGLYGKLENCKTPQGEQTLRLKLQPLRSDASCRLTRADGGRLLVIHLPLNLLPENLDRFVEWLLKPHSFLGRTWKLFWLRQDRVKISQDKKKQEQHPRGALAGAEYRFYFFGFDQKPEHLGDLDMENLLQQLVELSNNKWQPIFKLFARKQLSLSTTKATVEFLPHQIIRKDDEYSNNPREWRLDEQRSGEKKEYPTKRRRKPSGSSVMNDGCSRMSVKSARKVSLMLNLSYVPSAFQGRLGGAKGLWVVDTLGERLSNASHEHGDEWIEATDAQTKYESSFRESLPFEVLSWSQPLKSATLNIQALLVLLSRGVPYHVFRRLLVAQVKSESEELKSAMKDPLKLFAYIESKSPIRVSRQGISGMERAGGFPYSRENKLLWLLSSGFNPSLDARLVELCRIQLSQQLAPLREKLPIKITRSAVALITADHRNVLEENECSFCFSSPFPETQEIMIDGCDVLVARSPVLQPSDVKKLRAVFKRELSSLKDLIVFSSRGSTSTASGLSGGDYDGDKVWICWDQEVVDSFRSYQGSYEPKSEAFFGIKKDNTTYEELERETAGSPVQEFLRRCVKFNLQPSMISKVCTYHERYVYHQTSKLGLARALSDERAMDLACLFSYIIDAPKAGITFGSEEWEAYKVREGLPRDLSAPAYKYSGQPRDGMRHPVDKLVHDAWKATQEALTDFEAHKNSLDLRNYDADLAAIAVSEEKHSETDERLKLVLKDLRGQLRSLYEDWAQRMRSRRANDESEFRHHADEFRRRFLDIRPLQTIDCDIARRWQMECDGHHTLATGGSWARLKASMLFSENYRRGGWGVWYIGGEELGAIKAASTPGSVQVIRRMYDVMKADSKLVNRLDIESQLDTDAIEHDDLAWEDGEEDFATAFESFDEERR